MPRDTQGSGGTHGSSLAADYFTPHHGFHGNPTPPGPQPVSGHSSPFRGSAQTGHTTRAMPHSHAHTHTQPHHTHHTPHTHNHHEHTQTQTHTQTHHIFLTDSTVVKQCP